MAYDEKCEELARYFLHSRPDSADSSFTENGIKRLAQTIQDEIENWLDMSKRERAS